MDVLAKRWPKQWKHFQTSFAEKPFPQHVLSSQRGSRGRPSPSGCQLSHLCACCWRVVLPPAPSLQSLRSLEVLGPARYWAEHCVCVKNSSCDSLPFIPALPFPRNHWDTLDSLTGDGKWLCHILSPSKIRLLFLTLWLHLPALVFVLFHIWVYVDQIWNKTKTRAGGGR